MATRSKRRLTRRELAAFLTERGFPISAATIATRATRGGGPGYLLFSGRALYDEDEALRWAEAATAAPRRRTREADAPQRAA
jgi:hypothetical protein